jgi:putative acetyltransferase
MLVRDEIADDIAAIRAVVEKAFGRSDEARLVERLRTDGDSVISLVATEGPEVLGHVLFSRMTAPFPALGLAPVSVVPERQRTGIGSRLIREGVLRAQAARAGTSRSIDRRTARESKKIQNFAVVFVLGDPDYYRRFGFDPALASGFACAYAGPHFMALPLGDSLPVTTGPVAYAPAFAALG